MPGTTMNQEPLWMPRYELSRPSDWTCPEAFLRKTHILTVLSLHLLHFLQRAYQQCMKTKPLVIVFRWSRSPLLGSCVQSIPIPALKETSC